MKKTVAARLVKLAIELEEKGFKEEAADLDRIAGLFDFLKGKPDKGSDNKEQKMQYIADQIDSELASAKPERHKEILEHALVVWKLKANREEAGEIMSRLQNYQPPAEAPRPAPEQTWQEKDRQMWRD